MNRRRIRLLLVIIFASGIYVVSFVMLRNRVTLTSYTPTPHAAEVFYFSRNKAVNRIAYGVFYPFILATGQSLDADGNIPDGDLDKGVTGPYYIFNIDSLPSDM
jgi:hypothetical protein